jgi:hypothetical protein
MNSYEKSDRNYILVHREFRDRNEFEVILSGIVYIHHKALNLELTRRKKLNVCKLKKERKKETNKQTNKQIKNEGGTNEPSIATRSLSTNHSFAAAFSPG